MSHRASGGQTSGRFSLRARELSTDLLERGRAFLASWKMVRAGAVAFVVAGACGLAGYALFAVSIIRSLDEPPYSYAGGPLDLWAFFLQWVGGWAFVSFGMVGLCAALPAHRRVPRIMALVSAVLALLLAVVAFVGITSPESLGDSVSFYQSVIYGVPTVVALLAGLAAFRVKGLGAWKPLPLVAGLMSSPVAGLLVMLVYAGDRVQTATTPGWTGLLFVSPQAVGSAGWAILGFVLLGAREREAAIFAAKRRETEERNLPIARRLYERAWLAGDLSVVDELVAEDVSDRVHRRHGREEFKRAIRDLRRTFPDLRVIIESQTAGGDEVTTRCKFSGTDRGGVLWYPATNKRAVFTATYTDRFSEGKLVERRGEVDMKSLMRQLGLPAR